MFDCHAHYGEPTDNALVCTASPQPPANQKAFTFRSLGLIPEGGTTDVQMFMKNLEDSFVGEIGIDRRYPAIEDQLRLFRQCLDFAIQRKTLVTIHYVGYTDKLLKTLEDLRPQHFILHGFTGSLETAKAFSKLGGLVSLSPRALKTKGILPLLHSGIPFLTETDMPTGPEERAVLADFNQKLSLSLNKDVSAMVEKTFFDYISGIKLPKVSKELHSCP